jgi:hypothetical protein
MTGCGIRYPSSRTDIPDERPSIAFRGAPNGSVVFVDGQAMGSATQFDGGENVLLVEPGNHLIEVRVGERVLLTRRVFLSGQATRTFVVQ